MQANLQTRNLQNASWLGVSDIIHLQKRAEYEYSQVYFADNVIVKGLTEDESGNGSTYLCKDHNDHAHVIHLV